MAIRSWGRFVAVGFVALATMAAGTARAQVATVTVKSAGDLLDQFRTLAKQADAGSAKQMLDGLDALDQGGALKWLDRTKPVVATADVSQQGAPAVTLFVPVTGPEEFLDGIKGLGLAVDDQAGAEGFSHKIAPPGGNGQSAYLLANPPTGYAVLTSVPEGAAKLKAVKPAGLKPSRPGTILISLRIDRIPEQFKQQAIAGLKQQNQAARERKDGESDDQYQGRLAGLTFAEDSLTSLIRDSRELTLDADVREKAEKFTMALAIDAKPGTPMATSLGSFGTRRGKFLNLWRDAAVTLQGIVPVPEAFRKVIRKSIEQSRAKALKENADDARIASLVLDALTPTLAGEAYDACVAMGAEGKGAGTGGANVVLFGVGMKDSKKVEAALREAIAKKLKPEDRDKVALDHAKGSDGTAIHKFTLDAKQMKPEEFGDPLMFVAFPEGAALAAVGGNGLAVIKRSLAGLKTPAASGAGPVPQVGLDFSAVKFTKLSTENAAAFREAAGDVFQGTDAAKDRLHIGLTGEAARARLLLEADLPVLRFFVKVGAIQQKAKAEQAK